MLALQSLWTGAPAYVRDRATLLLHSFSVALLARDFKHTLLVTDGFGASMAHTLGWQYSDISTGLDVLPFDDVRQPRLLGKAMACAVQNEPFVYVDTCTLLLLALPASLVLSAFFIRNYGDFRDFEGMYEQRIISRLPPTRYIRPCNADVIGGSDYAAVSRVYTGMLLLDKLRNGYDETSFSAITESLSICHLAGCDSISTLFLSEAPCDADLIRTGYRRITGIQKKPYVAARVETRFQQQFPGSYAAFVKGWKTLAPFRR